MYRYAFLAALLVGCGGKPAPKKAAPELPVDGPASIAGEWVVDDDMGFFYTLTIGADGALGRKIDRGKMAPCEEGGKLAAGDKPKAFTLAKSKDTCHPDAANASIAVEVASFTGDVLTLVVTTSMGPERRTYRRRAKPQPAP
jgi:hypothetical protein